MKITVVTIRERWTLPKARGPLSYVLTCERIGQGRRALVKNLPLSNSKAIGWKKRKDWGPLRVDSILLKAQTD